MKYLSGTGVTYLWGKIKDKFVAKEAGKGLSTNDLTNALKTKLDSVASNANNYVHPTSHAPSIITQDSSNRFVTDAEKTAWNGKARPSKVEEYTLTATKWGSAMGIPSYLIRNNFDFSKGTPNGILLMSELATSAQINESIKFNLKFYDTAVDASFGDYIELRAKTKPTIDIKVCIIWL